MLSRLLSLINKHDILYAFQFGFRTMHSPNLALIILVDPLSRALGNGDFVLGLFLDFSKAFDTANHSILYNKIEIYYARGLAQNSLKVISLKENSMWNIIMFIQVKIESFVESN